MPGPSATTAPVSPSALPVAGPARRRVPGRIRDRLAGDRGSVSVEMVAAFPLLMLLLIVGLHVGLWALAQIGAQQAANHALQTTRVAGGTPAAGRADATALLHLRAGTFQHDQAVTVTRTGQTAPVTISGRSPALFGVSIPVHTTVSSPVERFRPFAVALSAHSMRADS
jgi:hypothetical protein